MSKISLIRKVVKEVLSIEQSEGVGATVRRSIGTFNLKNLDPFLMLDEFKVQYPAGFPDHPHRGFETVTYMISGTNEHEDFNGNKGIIGPGDLQWMTAGKGIVHAEMPLANSEEPVTGLQLWINLPASEKMCEPSYQDLKDLEIPRATPEDGIEIKVIAGESYGVTSPIRTKNPVYYMDFKMAPNKSAYQTLPAGFSTAFIYTLTGKIELSNSDKLIKAHTTVVLDNGEDDKESKVLFKTRDEPSHFVLIAGKPLNEPIEQYGPFVMNDEEGIKKTFLDYQYGRNGFENAKGWQSVIGRRGSI